ncbi:complement receptor type 1-like [Periophthalmus magnuspinnatus]|uniref:complement receptor type 1-like n=1 Tax=Periophthalmus magnuspinnatus TaxID=409849 RepID=UPI002436663F|nr:complement receptor type 1-like [Periophthalmus magnuspinnatus]
MRTFTHVIFILPCAFLSSVAEERVCSSPPEFPGASLMRYTQDTALFKCLEGHEAYGGSPVIRCSGGRWSTLTLQCRKKSCGSAGELMNGHFKYEGEAVFGDKAYPVCEDGYTIKGPKVITCGAKGWPADLPQCEEGAVPPPVTCPPPKVSNSEKKGVAHEYNIGAVLKVRCSPGFQVKGEERITCGSDGKWQPAPPQCVTAPAATRQCGVPENTAGTNSKLAPKFSSQKSFGAGTRVYYVCDVGYVPSRGSKYRWCTKGQWSPLELQCRRRLCGSAGELLYGHYEYTGVEFGDHATAVCDEGYQLFGHATRNCLSRGWDGHPPVCEALECDDPPEVANAETSGYAQAPYKYRTVVRYRCLVGTLMGPSDIWCTMNGTWSSPLPQCKDITCMPPNIPNASWVRSRTGRYQYRDNIYIQCDPRFTLVGPSTITCDERGQWAPELPKCKGLNRRG